MKEYIFSVDFYYLLIVFVFIFVVVVIAADMMLRRVDSNNLNKQIYTRIADRLMIISNIIINIMVSIVLIIALIHGVIFFGLVLCCTHLSDITLTIAANIINSFTAKIGKLY